MTLIGLLIGGLIGTIVMTMFMVMGKMMKMMPSDFDLMKNGMGSKINSMTGMPNNVSYVVHLMIGTFILPLIYDYVWINSLEVNFDLIGAIVFFLIFGLMMIFMLPFLGAPSDWRMRMAVGIIMGHIVYAVIVYYTNKAF